MGDAGPAVLPEVTDGEHVHEINVLVTGFGQFKSFLVNPSWLIASSLPSEIDLVPEKQRNASTSETSMPACRIRLHTYPSPVRVAYASTSALIPSLLDPRTNDDRVDYDFVLHIGLAAGRDSYTLETIAHRDNYKIKDVDNLDGYRPGECTWKNEHVPARLDIAWDKEDVLRRWEKLTEEVEVEEQDLCEQGLRVNPFGRKAVVKLSRDAGRFLCEFIFFTSLVERWKQAKNASNQDSVTKLGKVAFLHVPNGTSATDVNRGKRVVLSAVRALVDSWLEGYRNHDIPGFKQSGAFEENSTGDS